MVHLRGGPGGINAHRADPCEEVEDGEAPMRWDEAQDHEPRFGALELDAGSLLRGVGGERQACEVDVDHEDILSKTTAPPWPPPMHRVAKASSSSDSSSSWAAVRSSRAPVAPTGWPMAMAPPFLFVLSRSRVPTAFEEPRCSLANSFEENARSQARTCAAKASLSSMTPTSERRQSASARAAALAKTGPRPMRRGSQPAQE